MGSPSTPDTQTTVVEPWSKAAPHLEDIFATARGLFDEGAGPQEYPGATVVPFSLPTQGGIYSGVMDAAIGNPLAGTANTFANNIISAGGITPQMRGTMDHLTNIAGGGGDVNPNSLFSLASQGFGNAAAGAKNYNRRYLKDIASGNEIGGNPFFQDALDYQAQKVGEQVNQYFSGAGRTGSGMHGSVLATELGGLRNQALSDMYNADKARQLQASNLIQSGQDSSMGLRLGALQGQLGATQAGLGTQAGNIERQTAAAQAAGGLSNEGVLNALRFSSIAPELDNLRYADTDRLLSLGSVIEGKQGEHMQDALNRFNFRNNLPFTQLQMYREAIEPTAMAFRSTTADGMSSGGGGMDPSGLLSLPFMMMGK